MVELISKVEALKNDPIREVIDSRVNDFMNIRYDKDRVFLELCFCLMTANFQAEKSWQIQEKLKRDFFEADEMLLAKKLKAEGHRFWPQRAERIVLAREAFDELFFMLDQNEHDVREWIVQNIKGLGMKEASHFLRNIGFNDVAIIDFHIVDLLVAEGIMYKPKTITPKIYLEIEEALRYIANELGMGLGELDLYLWYLETGKVLK